MPSHLPAPAPSTRYPPGSVVAVQLPLPIGGAYDYRVGEQFSVADGDFVKVPLGPRVAQGVVWGPAAGGVAESKLKAIISLLDCPPLPAVSRRFIDWTANYTLQEKGLVLKMAMSVRDALDPPKPIPAYVKSPEQPEIRLTPARQRILALMADSPPRTTTDIAREAATSPGVVKGLYEAGALTKVQLVPTQTRALPDPNRAGPVLSDEQATAAAAMRQAVRDDSFSVSLLDGVPGSGKTEVYFEAICEALGGDGQVLVLLPEIALSAQWLDRFRARFGANPSVWHSDLTMSQRRNTWRDVATGRASVVVGARSALFLPFRNLRLIVVDEEHDGAFKQEDGVIYNARDMAVVRAQLGAIPITLASATPSLESVLNAANGRYRLHGLPIRHAGAEMPDVKAVNMIKTPPPRGRWLSPPLAEAITKTVGAGEQVLLFLNRRGYAPLTLCRTCGHRFQCPRCTAWLVEHRLAGRLQCHHCGFHISPPKQCPECETEDSLVACGPGVERLAEEITTLIPDIRMTIAASDNIQSPRAAGELVRRIENHDVDLIIGTQIIAKGYHFPLLTLVGVIDADLGLQGGDPRAAERTFQLLYQVAGRAGRGEKPGKVLIQTYMEQHPVMQALLSGDKEVFIETETIARRDALMPPFGRLVSLIVSGFDEAAVDQAALALARAAPSGKNIQVLGPAPAPFALLRGRHRRRLLLKASKDTAVQPLVRHWLARTERFKKVRIQVDVDPMSFF
ncbi:MAG: primosomal protein N' [Rhodospirillales bacterium]|nr:primosomal protein N' [Rhodospirillales bacterium]